MPCPSCHSEGGLLASGLCGDAAQAAGAWDGWKKVVGGAGGTPSRSHSPAVLETSVASSSANGGVSWCPVPFAPSPLVESTGCAACWCRHLPPIRGAGPGKSPRMPVLSLNELGAPGALSWGEPVLCPHVQIRQSRPCCTACSGPSGGAKPTGGTPSPHQGGQPVGRRHRLETPGQDGNANVAERHSTPIHV